MSLESTILTKAKLFNLPATVGYRAIIWAKKTNYIHLMMVIPVRTPVKHILWVGDKFREYLIFISAVMNISVREISPFLRLPTDSLTKWDLQISTNHRAFQYIKINNVISLRLNWNVFLQDCLFSAICSNVLLQISAKNFFCVSGILLKNKDFKKGFGIKPRVSVNITNAASGCVPSRK